jgi:hypothetical protein
MQISYGKNDACTELSELKPSDIFSFCDTSYGTSLYMLIRCSAGLYLNDKFYYYVRLTDGETCCLSRDEVYSVYFYSAKLTVRRMFT